MPKPRLPALRYDWAALEYLRKELGEDYASQLDGGDLKTLAVFIAVGSGREAGEVFTDSPPIVPMVNAATAALMQAYYGPSGEPPEDKEPSGKPTRLTLWSMLRGLRFRSG